MSVKLSAPISVEIALTRNCNHRCIHCYNPFRQNSDRTTIVRKYGLDFVVSELQKSNVMKVVITGGEPLIFKEKVLDLIRMIKSADIEVSLNTNLTLIDQDFINSLKSIGNVGLFVSIPGLSRKNCDTITNCKGSYGRIMKGLQLCLDNNLDLGINIVVSKITNYDYQSISELVEKYPNIVSVSLSPVVPPEYDSKNPIFKLTNEDLIIIKEILIKLNNQYHISVGSSIPLPICVIGNELCIRNHSSVCCAGRTDCAIDIESGDILACSGFDESFGNIYTDGLISSWNKMEKWRDTSLLNRDCKECRYLPLCSGECRMLTKFNVGPILNPNISLDFYEPTITIDKDRNYSINPVLKIRKEEFGAVLYFNDAHLLCTETVCHILNMIQKKDSFTLNELSDYIELDDNCLKLFSTFLRLGFIVPNGF